MIWALLAFLGVPLWLVVGGLAGTLWSRREFRKQPGVFAAKLRLESGSFPGFGKRWPHVSSYCVWVHHVLLVHKGLALMRTIPVPVTAAHGPAQHADTGDMPSHDSVEMALVKRLGEDPVLMRYRLDDGSILQVSAPNDSSALLQGPFTVETQPQEARARR